MLFIGCMFVAYRVFMCCLSFSFFRSPTYTFCPGGMSIERSVSGQNNPESGSSLHFIPDDFDRTWTPNAMRIVNAGPCVRYCHSCVSCVMTYVFLLYYFIFFMFCLLVVCLLPIGCSCVACPSCFSAAPHTHFVQEA